MDVHEGAARRVRSIAPVRASAAGAVALVLLGVVAGFAATGLFHLAGTASAQSGRATAGGRALAELYHLEGLRAAAASGESISSGTIDPVVVRLDELVRAATGRGEADAELRADVRRFASAILVAVLRPGRPGSSDAAVSGAQPAGVAVQVASLAPPLDAGAALAGADAARATSAAIGPARGDPDGDPVDARGPLDDPLNDPVASPMFRSLESRLTTLAVESEARSAAAARSARWGVVVFALVAVVVALGLVWWIVAVNRRSAAHRAAGSAHARFRSLVEASHDQVYLIGPAGEVWYASPAAERFWGADVPPDLATLLGVIDEPERSRLRSAVAGGVALDQPLGVRVHLSGGTVAHFEVGLRDLRAAAGVGGVVVTARDVTVQRELQELLRRQALEDELTGLPNRRALNAAIAGALGRADRHRTLAGVILLDLDEFKRVNDTLGHPAGDELLRQVAQRLRVTRRAGETIARLGGDEFAIVLEDVDGEDAARRAASRFREALRPPFDLDGRQLPVHASLGVAVAGPGGDADEVLRQADIALYEAKESGGAQLAAFRHPALSAPSRP